LNVTDPVGVPVAGAMGATVAVKVTDSPLTDEILELVRVVVVVMARGAAAAGGSGDPMLRGREHRRRWRCVASGGVGSWRKLRDDRVRAGSTLHAAHLRGHFHY